GFTQLPPFGRQCPCGGSPGSAIWLGGSLGPVVAEQAASPKSPLRMSMRAVDIRRLFSAGPPLGGTGVRLGRSGFLPSSKATIQRGTQVPDNWGRRAVNWQGASAPRRRARGNHGGVRASDSISQNECQARVAQGVV